MKLISFTVPNMSDIYENWLALETVEDLDKYHKLRQVRTSTDFENTLTKYLNGARHDMHETALHYSKDGIVKLSTLEAVRLNNGSCVDAAIQADKHLFKQYQIQLKQILEGNIIVVNEKLGYHWRDPQEMTIINTRPFSTRDLRDFVLGKYDFDNMDVTNDKNTIIAFVLTKDYKICSIPNVVPHDVLCKLANLGYDDVYKFVYHKRVCRAHTTFCQGGIYGLRESVVYDMATKPFELTNEHYKAIQKFIDRVEGDTK